MILFCAGCASLDTRLPEIDPRTVTAEQVRQEASAFAEMETLRARFINIADPILTANAELCEKTRPGIGITTQTLKDYPKGLRDAAAREMGLGDEPRIIYVRPNSPADRAGIKIGDKVKGNDDGFLSERSKAFTSEIEAGEVLTIIRGGESFPVKLTPEAQCDFRLKLKMSSAINAMANGKSIIMFAGMMDFAKSDEELAYVIGHELAHNTKGHIRKIVTNYILSGLGTRFIRPFEAEADYVGLYYAARAGYNIDNVEDLWRRLARQSIRPVYKAKTHPTFPSRYVQIAAARDEIKMKQSAGEALRPNPKRKKDGP